MDKRKNAIFLFLPEIPFLGNFGPKTQNYEFKLKFDTSIISNSQKSMVMFIFSAFDRKYSFWANLVLFSQISMQERKNKCGSVMYFVRLCYFTFFLIAQIFPILRKLSSKLCVTKIRKVVIGH